MRNWLLGTIAGGAVVLSLGFGATAEASDEEGTLPADFNEELAEQFRQELLDVLTEGGVEVDPANLDNLIGEPGDLDAAPGEPVLLQIAGDAATLATEPIEGDGDSSLTGPCMGLAISFDDEANIIDIAGDFSAAAPPIDLLEFYESDRQTVKAAFTADNPYKVHVDGFVAYAGIAGPSGGGPTNHTWAIETFGQALDEGGDDNPDRENRNAGGVNFKDQLPAPAKVRRALPHRRPHHRRQRLRMHRRGLLRDRRWRTDRAGRRRRTGAARRPRCLLQRPTGQDLERMNDMSDTNDPTSSGNEVPAPPTSSPVPPPPPPAPDVAPAGTAMTAPTTAAATSVAATSPAPPPPPAVATPVAPPGAAPTQTLKRHPIRGALWGLLLGIGVTLFLIGQKVVAFGTLPPILVIVAGIVVGIIWSCFGPAKQKEAEPAR